MRNNKEKIIVSNKIKCLLCEDVIESTNVHDFKWCKCGSVAVDGGKSYLKRCCKKYDGVAMPYEDLSVVKNRQFTILEVFTYEDGTVFTIPELDIEEVILIACGDGVKRLFNKETGRRILMAEDYLNAKYELGE